MHLQGNKQVTRAAIEWYGPDRAGVSRQFHQPDCTTARQWLCMLWASRAGA